MDSEKYVLFLSSASGLIELKKAVKTFKEKDIAFTIISESQEANLALEREKLSNRLFSEYYPPSEIVDHKGIDWIKKFQNAAIKDSKNIKELFTYEDVSLWWFIDYWLYDSSFYFAPSLKDVIKNIEGLSRICEIEKPTKILLFGIRNSFSTIVNLFFESRSIEVVCPGRYFLKIGQKLSLGLVPYFKLFLMFSRLILRKVLWVFFKTVHRYQVVSPGSSNRIVLFSADYWKRVIDPITLRPDMGDGYLHSVATKLAQNPKNSLMFVGVVRGFNKGIGVMKQRIASHGLFYSPFENYVSLSMILKVALITLRKRNSLNSLINSDGFSRLLYYNRVPLGSVISRRIAFFFGHFSFVPILNIEMAKRFIDKEKPKAIVISEETVTDGRAVIIAAKKAGVSVLCVQHGIIGQFGLVDCEHEQGDIHPNGSIAAPYCPIPDKMAVYGITYKRKCMEVSKYPESILEVTGSPRYDILADFGRVCQKSDILSNLSKDTGFKLSPEKKIILLLSQPLQSLKERELVLRYTYCAVKKLKNVQLIVKLHPGEFSDAMHKRVAVEEGLNDVILVQKFDTYELLYICDLAIAAFSTAQLEAIALGKPTISIDVFNRSYWAGLDEDKLIMSASDELSVYQLIESILFNQAFSKKLLDSINSFKMNQLCGVDGLATERIAEIITAQIAEYDLRRAT